MMVADQENEATESSSTNIPLYFHYSTLLSYVICVPLF